MSQIIWGLLSALSLGTADFMAGLSGRSIGYGRALLAVFVISSIGLSLYMVIDGQPMTIDLSRQWLIIIFGVLMTVAMLLLYLALALGPLSVAAPIVAAHPVIVVLFAFALGSRPSILQWVGMALATLGAVIVARAISGDSTAEDRLKRRKTVIVASCASVVYATVIIAGQHAVPIHGELQTLWLGRVISLMTLIVFLGFTRTSPLIPIRWWPFLCLQGTLDAGGILFLLYGSAGDFTEITAVIGSLFGAVTILLARVFLKEPDAIMLGTSNSPYLPDLVKNPLPVFCIHRAAGQIRRRPRLHPGLP